MNNAEYSFADLGWDQTFQSQLSIEDAETFRPYRVTEVHRNALNAITTDGPARLPMTGDLVDHGVAVGDWILVEKDTGRPTRVLDRKSLLKRRAAGTEPSAQLIAANVDTLFIVSSCNADFNVARLERYLALARQAEIEPVLILTKADLCDDPAGFRRKSEVALPGIVVETVIATSDQVAETFEPWCSGGQTAALLGSSGVGKTTIINVLTGAASRTEDIRSDDSKGRHTTTRRSMFRTNTGGWLIDTPGMRALRLADVKEGVEMVFQDVADLAATCRFNDCAHDSEPGCAVQAAISAGDLDRARVARWQKLRLEDLRHSESLAEYHTRSRNTQKTYRAGKEREKFKKNQLFDD